MGKKGRGVDGKKRIERTDQKKKKKVRIKKDISENSCFSG